MFISVIFIYSLKKKSCIIEIELFVVAPVVIDVVGIVVIRVSVNCCGPVAIVAVVVVEG